MSFSFSNSDPPHTPDAGDRRSPDECQPQQEGSVDYEAEAVRTFEFEVSAGRSAKLTSMLSAGSSVPRSVGSSAQHSAGSSAQRSAGSSAPRSVGTSAPRSVGAFPQRPGAAAHMQTRLPSNQTPEVAAPVVEANAPLVGPGMQTTVPAARSGGARQFGRVASARVTKTVGPAPPVAAAKQVAIAPKKTLPLARLARRQSSWWIVSLGIHALLLLLLAFTTLVVFQEQEQLELYTSTADYETIEEFQDLEINPADELETLEQDIAAELDEPAAATFADLTSETQLDQPVLGESTLSASTAVQLTGSLGEMGQLFGENGSGMSDIGIGTGGAMVKFFGTEVKARRILYMLDNSGGMLQGGKFEALISELQASVGVLEAKQRFYVIFFSDTVYPLFYPQSVRRFMPASDRNRKQLGLWLDSVELCTGNAIDEALAAAEVIRPDAIFLLTDGNLFTTDKKKALLLNRAGRTYSIHTFGLGVGEQTKTAAGLKQVAEANDGTFRAVKVSAATKELAQQKQRIYHSKHPGAIWGLKVGLR